jgi:predicted nuclease of restriction endonuclease-like (RecB) superfamily
MGNELTPQHIEDFNEVLTIIETARTGAYRAVNSVFIGMYWDIGAYVSDKVSTGRWGKSVVNEFSDFVQSHLIGIQGFSPSNIWRMRQFFETYKDNEKLATLSREISWSNNVLIMSRAKTDEAREFYLRLATRNNYSVRELGRQIDTALFERTMISDEKNKLFLAKNPGLTALRDNYVLEFLDIPKGHKERDLRKGILSNLKDFILEFGKDFALVGEEFRIQVGNRDYKIDLLFFNRELCCLVAIELKVEDFEPSHLGQLEFYLEALDSDVKKPHENPSVGLVLCAGKDDTVVEYALRRSISPALVAEYQLHLPDKTVLENKLKELTEYAKADALEDEE